MKTSDTVGAVAAVVIAAVIVFLTLWFCKVPKKKTGQQNGGAAPGTTPAGPANTAAGAPPGAGVPAPANPGQQMTASGGNAHPAAVINGASAPVPPPAKVAEPAPTPTPAATVIRTLDDDETVII